MKKVLLLGSQHGNERLGDMLYAHIRSHRRELLPHVTYRIGNLRAYKQGVRYIEQDLNRSYTGNHTTYEERRAIRLLRYIEHENFDLVLDLHTTTCRQPPCIIIPADYSGERLAFIKASRVSNIVCVKHEIVKGSLIGNCPRAISVEVSVNEAAQFVDALCADMAAYLNGMQTVNSQIVYEVTDLLKKNELTKSELRSLQNFEPSKHGFYPVLVGENSYKKQTSYLGFKAYTVYKLRV